MHKRNRAIDSRFRPHWRNYVLQSGLATVSVFEVLMALRQQNLVVAESLAATAFTFFPWPSSLSVKLFYALAVGCSIFLMAITNTEHPPAAGTALGIVIAGFSWRLGLGALIGVSILSAIHRLLRTWLIDLVLPPELSHLRYPAGPSPDGREEDI